MCNAVYEFDRRLPANQARLVAILWEGASKKAEANSICSPARKPHLIAVGGGDGRLRVFDRRMQSAVANNEVSALRTVCLMGTAATLLAHGAGGCHVEGV